MYCSAVEVFRNAQDYRFVLWDAFNFVAPLSGNLHGRLYSFCSCVHGQYHVESEKCSYKLGELWEDIVVECPRAQRQSACLLRQRLHKLRMTMALIDGAVRGQKVQIMAAFWIPYRSTRGPCKDNGQRVIVVRSVGVFVVYGSVGRAGMIARWIWRAGRVEGGCGSLEGCASRAIGMAIGGWCGNWSHS